MLINSTEAIAEAHRILDELDKLCVIMIEAKKNLKSQTLCDPKINHAKKYYQD